MDLYKNQVKLLLDVIPLIEKEEVYALHGGTAINLFVRNMPRLSVDIDLTYVPIEDRNTSLAKIYDSLERVKQAILTTIPSTSVTHQKDKFKLQISSPLAQIKVEVNPTGRGLLYPSRKMPLCDKTQEDFDTFCSINVVSLAQLYGGKICAALDRQHPRDFFDVKYLLENEGYSDEIKSGFIFSLLGSSRPLHEIIKPNNLDQRETMVNQFNGMTAEEFSYDEFEEVRDRLITEIHQNFTDADKEFLIAYESGNPNWGLYDFKDYPAIKWKLQNLEKFRSTDIVRHKVQIAELERKLKG